MKKLFIATLLCIATASSAKAFTYVEADDSGQLISTAQIINSSNATSTATDPSLTSITGTITSSNADIFGIFLTAGQIFTATTAPVSGATNYNSQLFLFDSQGFGLVANDSLSGTLLLSNISFTPTTTGTYYLAISGFNYDPRDAQGLFIFPDTQTGLVTPTPGVGALASWAARVGSGTPSAFNYNIGMTGAAPVPEPVMGGSFLAFASLGLISAFRRKKQLD